MRILRAAFHLLQAEVKQALEECCRGGGAYDAQLHLVLLCALTQNLNRCKSCETKKFMPRLVQNLSVLEAQPGLSELHVQNLTQH